MISERGQLPLEYIRLRDPTPFIPFSLLSINLDELPKALFISLVTVFLSSSTWHPSSYIVVLVQCIRKSSLQIILVFFNHARIHFKSSYLPIFTKYHTETKCRFSLKQQFNFLVCIYYLVPSLTLANSTSMTATCPSSFTTHLFQYRARTEGDNDEGTHPPRDGGVRELELKHIGAQFDGYTRQIGDFTKDIDKL